MAADLSTPEKALQALETAYVRSDLEAAVAARDFRFEAREMLRAMNPTVVDDDLVKQTSEVLELAFRKEMKSNGFPPFKDLRCTVVKRTELAPGLVEMMEECVFPDGAKSREPVHAAKSDVGWRIVVLPPNYRRS